MNIKYARLIVLPTQSVPARIQNHQVSFWKLFLETTISTKQLSTDNFDPCEPQAMSEPIPESVPTSADPKSKRPVKKRALTPVSQQANQLDALFAKPDREIPLPSSALTNKTSLSAPPEIVANVQGSSAGAGSGEFHVYKASRRREYERVKRMDEEVAREAADADFEKKQAERKKRDEEKTSKNRKRREKLKMKKGKGEEGPEKESEDRNGIPSGGGDGVEKGEGAGQGAPPASAETIGVIIHDDD